MEFYKTLTAPPRTSLMLIIIQTAITLFASRRPERRLVRTKT